MFGKIFFALGFLLTTVTAATFNYGQAKTFIISTASYLNDFAPISSTCYQSAAVQVVQGNLPSVCSSADVIDYLNYPQEASRISSLFSTTGAMLTNIASSLTPCEVPVVKTLVQSKAQELLNWSAQLNGGAPVSLSQFSVVSGLKSMVSNLELGFMSSAGYDLAEIILYDL